VVSTLQNTQEKTLLPFAVSSQADTEFFTDEVEKAAVLCISELDRETGGGFFRKQAPEKLVFLSKVYYPFWVAPLKEATLLLDGLNQSSHTINYQGLPDLKSFKDNLTNPLVTRQAHLNFLTNHQNYFKIDVAQQNFVIEGLLNDKKLTKDYLDYIKEAKKTNAPVPDTVFITSALNKNGVTRMVQNIETTWLKIREEVTVLNEIIKLLNRRTQEALKILNGEITATKEKFIPKIQKAKTDLEKTTAKINKEYSAQVTEISNKFDKQITDLQKENLKQEKIMDQIKSEIGKAEAEIRTAAINKDDSTEQKWKTKVSTLKKQLPDISDEKKKIQKQILEVENNKKNELFQLKQENDAKIKDAGMSLLEIEAAQDGEIRTFQSEMQKFEELTSDIITQVDELAKGREALILEFEDLGVKQKRTEVLLVYMPFYLSCYQSKSKKRYAYVAPSTISGSGLGLKLKAVGKTKISKIFQQRSKEIVLILNKFMRLLDEDIVFNRDISGACLKANLLESEKAKEEVLRGLTALQVEGWLSDREFAEFSLLYS
jgi:hypothetical protein